MSNQGESRSGGHGRRRFAATVYTLALGLWVGSMAFFSAVVLPVLFTQMPPAQAGSIAALIFPYYYNVGLALAAVVTATALSLAGDQSLGRRVALGVSVLMLLCQAYASVVLHPEMVSLRGVPHGEIRFQVLHRRSVWVNGVTLVAGLLLLGAAGSASGRD